MKKESTLEVRKEVHTPVRQTNTANLAEAVKSVYQRYGTDLSSFFRDAYEAEARKREKAEADKTTPNHSLEVYT